MTFAVAIASIIILPFLIGWLFSAKQKPSKVWAWPDFGVYHRGMTPRCRPASSEY